jgi:hypothetical protein
MRLTHNLVSGGSEKKLRDTNSVRTEHDDIARSFASGAENLAMCAANRHHGVHPPQTAGVLRHEALQLRGARVRSRSHVRTQRIVFSGVMDDGFRSRRHFDDVHKRQVRVFRLSQRQCVFERMQRGVGKIDGTEDPCERHHARRDDAGPSGPDTSPCGSPFQSPIRAQGARSLNGRECP